MQYLHAFLGKRNEVHLAFVHQLVYLIKARLDVFGMGKHFGLLLELFLLACLQLGIVQLLYLETDVFLVLTVLFGLHNELSQLAGSLFIAGIQGFVCL